MRNQQVDRLAVAVRSVPVDRADAGAPDVVDLAEGFAPRQVGDVHLDGRKLHGQQRVEQRDARVSVGGGVENKAVVHAARGLDAVDQNALVVRLENVDLDAAQRGLGTASCGPDTLPKYRLSAGRTTLRYRVVPV